jgi:hypothetical protein
MNPRVLTFCTAMMLASTTASAQPTDTPGDSPRWHGIMSLSNLYDGNINHDVEPIRSYGIVPAAEIVFESSSEPAFAFGYEIASNRYTGTDEWDRVSHSLNAVWSYRLGSRLRFETQGSASWKGSSEDRELANEFGGSQRVAIKITSSTRVAVTGAYRYKQYPDEPETTGPSPYVAAKLDRKFAAGRRLTVGYKYQSRLSQSVRDRYRRSAYAVDYSFPVSRQDDRITFEAEYRPQRYERLIKVGNERVLRMDQRFIAGAAYERPLNDRASARWFAGVETRNSNDPDKHFMAPSFGMSIAYRVR